MPTTQRWQEQIKLARNEQVFIESGGITWLFNSEFYPFPGAIRAIREAIDICGIDKLMWGSDYPRTITAITYRMAYDFVVKSSELSDEQKRKLWAKMHAVSTASAAWWICHILRICQNKKKNMKAVQITGLEEMAVVELEKPEIKSNEVLLKMNYVGFCGSDLSTFLGKNPMVKMPVVPGHEVSAVIEAVGDEVPDVLKPGMLVTVDPYSNCGKCASCRRERANACEHNETLGVQRWGAMREYYAMPWQKIIPAEGLTEKEIALIEPMSVGFHAVNRAEVTDIDVVMVIGCGMIGIGAIVRASLRGATVIATDLDDDKLALAKRMGATYVVNTAKEDLHARLEAITGGLGPDVVIEAVGSPFTQNQAINEVAFTGRVVFIGYAKAGTEFITKLFVQKELDIRGSRNAKPADFRAVIHYMQHHPDYPKEELISAVATPDTAFEAMKQWAAAPAKVFRILVEF